MPRRFIDADGMQGNATSAGGARRIDGAPWTLFERDGTSRGMHCAFCRNRLGYVHGHAACLDGRCPMFGVNQAECCSGDLGDCPPTSMIASVGAVPRDGATPATDGKKPPRKP